MHSAVFDLDGTIYAENSMVAFLESFHASHAPSRALALRASRSLPGRAAWRAANSLTHRDAFRAFALATLRGSSRDALLEAVPAYVDRLASRSIAEVMARLESYRANGTRLLLASASLEPIVAEVARRLGMAGWVASIPATRDGVYTGRWETDVRGMKLTALLEKYPDVNSFDVVTDNFDDGDLIGASQRAIAVVEPMHAARWKARYGVRLETIELRS